MHDEVINRFAISSCFLRRYYDARVDVEFDEQLDAIGAGMSREERG